jgi:MFS family permease
MDDPHSAEQSASTAAHAGVPASAALPAPSTLVDSPYAWRRLAAALLLSTLGGVGMWSVVVALPAVQAEFGVARAAASLPYTFTMICFGLGGMVLGRLSDRFGVASAVRAGAVCLALGYAVASVTGSLWQFALVQGLLIGLGSSATFAPLMADASHWFTRRRGIAVAIIASGNYLSGTLWPPVLQHFIATQGWRATYLGVGGFCLLTMLPVVLMLRGRAPAIAIISKRVHAATTAGLSPRTLQILLTIAGLSCCVAMSMPQVHIVAYCADLGYGPARGAQMLSLMLGFGIVSRIASGWITDHIGGLRTLLVGSSLQGIALLLFIPFDGLVSLYVIAALFGLFQGGIVPSYAIIVREYFPSREAGGRVGIVIMATVFGMALGGWMSGAIFDLTGSYRAAFVNGMLWNLVNVSIVVWLLQRGGRRLAPA